MMVTIYVAILLLTGFLLLLSIYATSIYKKAHDLNPLHLEKEELQNQINIAHDTLAQAREKRDQIDAQVKDAEATILEKKRCEEYLEEHQKEKEEKETEIERLDAEMKDRLDNIASLEKDRQELSTQIDSANTELKKITAEKVGTESLIAELKERISSCTSERDALEAEIRKLKTEASGLDEQWASLNQKVQAAEERLKGIDDEFSKKVDELEADYTKKVNNLEASFEKKKADLEEQFAFVKAGYEEKSAELERLYQERKKELHELIDQMAEELAKLKEEKEKIAAEIAELLGKKFTLTVDVEKLNGENDAVAKRWEDLDRPAVTEKRDKPVEGDEIEWLEEFNSQLKDHSITFDPRTIYAFHTGLKSESISPMVVLSGISGTGKSLLPQLYSQAMGMNFQQVAVQPRWDSPQDMMGFYNYMQNKFKGTALSRLLWQYDIYNNDKAADLWCDGQDDKMGKKLPMNIVLLDEMNLARVEYYFSDLLSKLEVRKNVNVDDKTRLAAEIELEGGAISDVAQTRNLFINMNTLFVGTMNEDETTQNLSDKVMDRSNVLRFGKPADLQSKPDKDGLLLYYKNQFSDGRYMSYEQWNKWTETENCTLANIDWAKNIVSMLNNEFARLERPFAHRVWQSIEKYIKVYPKVFGENSYKTALADQIEMKLIPKLSGLDVTTPVSQNAFENIKQILGKVGDEQLSDAFEKASSSDSENIFFTWKGTGK